MQNVQYKKLPAFTCDAEALSDVLLRIVAITDYGQNAAANKQHIIIASDGQLFILGLSQDVTAYLSIAADITAEGICSICATDIIGVLKKRKGDFYFEGAQGNLKYKSAKTKYQGQLALKELTPDIKEAIDGINTGVKGTMLKPDMLTELKRGVKCVKLKDVVFDNALNIMIQCVDGAFATAASDGYHALIYRAKTQHKSKDFCMSVTGAAYNVIDKFINNQAASFSIGSTLLITNKTSMYAAIPSTQIKEDEFGAFKSVEAASKEKFLTEFVLDCSLSDKIANMFTLKSSSLEMSSSFNFEQKDGKLKITYATSSGSTAEIVKCKSFSGKHAFSIGERMLHDTLSSFSACTDITMRVNEAMFFIIAETDEYKLIGAGALDEK